MKKIYLIAAATIALSACSSDTESYVDEPIAAQISATIGNNAVTRAADTSWGTDDEIGVTMEGRYANIKYTTEEGNGIFKGSPLYFKNKREPVTLIAYYPFSGIEGTALDVIDGYTPSVRQSSDEQAKFDFLFAKKENVTGLNPEVKFDFSHVMSKITLIFKNGTGADVNNITSYTIEGLILKGSFNPTNGICAAQSVDAEPIDIDLTGVTVVSGESVNPLIVFPQKPAADSILLKIKDNEDQDYACYLNFGNDGLMSGNNYQFTITVNKTGVKVDKSTISDWDKKAFDNDANSVLE